ncbi:MAG: cation:proton antiporter [Desulfurococcales archaeon]|nr:cation:proton antiporter [Desulfurococcales archaeon]
MYRGAGRGGKLAIGLALSVAALTAARWGVDIFHGHEELFVLSVIAMLLAGSSLIADAIGVAAAVVELVLGVGAGVLGLESNEALEVLALVGSVFIMYVAGLEIDPRLLRRYLVPSMGSGLVGLLVPTAVVYVLLRFMGYGPEASLLVGIALSATSVAIVFAIVKKWGMTRSVLGQIIISASMIIDIGGVLGFVLVTAGLDLLIVLYMIGLVAAVYLFARFLRYAAGGENEVELRLIIAFLLAVSLVGEKIGVHAILFAFLLGIATRDVILHDKALEEKVAGLTFGLLAPIFFISAGLHSAPKNITGLLSDALLLFAVSYVVQVVVVHYALRFLTGRRIRARLSHVFGAKLTVSTIIAYTGSTLGILDERLAGVIIVAAILSTITSAIATGTRVRAELEDVY